MTRVVPIVAVGIAAGVALGACGGKVDMSESPYPLTSTGASTGSSPGCAGRVAGRYVLVQRRNFASPLPEPTGIAYDGQSLWVLSNGPSLADPMATGTIVRMDLDTLAVDRALRLHTPTLQGAVLGGLAWDGQALWAASADDLNALFRIDPATGDITKTMSSPTELGPADLDFDGTDLWLSTGTGDAYRVDRVAGTLLSHLKVGGVSSRDYGIAVRPCELWVGELLDNGMQIFDPDSGALLSSAVDDHGASFSSVGRSLFIRDQLVIANDGGITFYDVLPSD